MEITANKPAPSNPMFKIFLIVGVAIVIFLIFTVFSVNESIKGNEKLSAIKSLYFPVLERMDANTVRLDKMEEQFVQSVIIGERDLLEHATEIQKEADRVFVELGELYPQRKKEIEDLRKSFVHYHDLANKTSLDMLKKRGEGVEEQSAMMNKVLEELKNKMKHFRQSSYNNFVETLVDAQQGAKLNMILGLSIGGMNLIFIGILVYFIRNNIKMMAIIAMQNATLELRVAERTAELNQKKNDIEAMLQNMDLGVCTIVQDNYIHSEHSKFLCTIFDNTEFSGKDVLEGIFAKSTLGVDIKDQISTALKAIIGEDSMMYDFNSHLLVKEMEIVTSDNNKKVVQVNWNPIVNEDGNVDKVLFISQDVTQLRELELQSQQQKEELGIIGSIIAIPAGKFNDFISSTQKFINENRKLIESASGYDKDTVAALFRNMHTIKGNARTYGFSTITNAAHTAEHHYDELRNNPAEHAFDINKMLQDLSEVEKAVLRYVDVNDNKLGRKGRASDSFNNRGIFVSEETINTLKVQVDKLAKTNSNPEFTALEKNIHALDKVSLNRIITGATDALDALAKDLEKPVPHVKIEDKDIVVGRHFAESLKSSLIHILRNSMDHGIESPQERVENNKPEVGNINFSCVHNNHHIELHISDDGRGLALHKLYEKGVANGIFAVDQKPSSEEIAELIFHSGLSTAESVTAISGRGVGMDAIRTFLQEQNATIKVALENFNDTTLGFVPFRLIISLPGNAPSNA